MCGGCKLIHSLNKQQTIEEILHPGSCYVLDENGHPFFLHPRQKNLPPKVMMIFYQNKIQKVLMMIKKMVDVFAKFG